MRAVCALAAWLLVLPGLAYGRGAAHVSSSWRRMAREVTWLNATSERDMTAPWLLIPQCFADGFYSNVLQLIVTVGVLHELGVTNKSSFVVVLPELFHIENALKKGSVDNFVATRILMGPRPFSSLFNATHFARFVSARGMVDAATFGKAAVPRGCAPPSFIHGLARQHLFRCSRRVRKGRWSTDIDRMEIIPSEKDAQRCWSQRRSITSGAYTNRTCATHTANRTCTLSNLVGDIRSGSAKVVPNISWGIESCARPGHKCPVPPRYRTTPSRKPAGKSLEQHADPADAKEPSSSTPGSEGLGARSCPGSDRIFVAGAPVSAYDFNYYGEKMNVQLAAGTFSSRVPKVMLQGAGGVSATPRTRANSSPGSTYRIPIRACTRAL